MFARDLLSAGLVSVLPPASLPSSRQGTELMYKKSAKFFQKWAAKSLKRVGRGGLVIREIGNVLRKHGRAKNKYQEANRGLNCRLCAWMGTEFERNAMNANIGKLGHCPRCGNRIRGI